MQRPTRSVRFERWRGLILLLITCSSIEVRAALTGTAGFVTTDDAKNFVGRRELVGEHTNRTFFQRY